MSRVRIVGGGLTGILAAFQAHRMGARNIELYERLDQLGGVALPEVRDGCEMREGCVYFGPTGDPLRSLLEQHGAQFEDFDNRFGSVSPGTCAPVYVEDFSGPAIAASNISLAPLGGLSLADRLACYDDALAFPAGPLRPVASWLQPRLVAQQCGRAARHQPCVSGERDGGRASRGQAD
jgi:phytoene dehydrogenase-like protein